MEIGTDPLPRPSRWVTLVLSILLSIVIVTLLVVMRLVDPLKMIDRPAETTIRVLESDLLLDEGLTRSPSWMRLWLLHFPSSSRGVRRQAADGYSEFLRVRPQDAASHRSLEELEQLHQSVVARLLILEAEAGDWTAVEEKLPLTSPSMADVLRYVYGGADRPALPFSIDVALSTVEPKFAPELGLGWTGHTLARRYYTRAGQTVKAAETESSLTTEEVQLEQSAVLLSLGYQLPILAGLLIGLQHVIRRRPLPVLASGVSAPPWSFARGYAVIVRAAFLAGLLGGGYMALADMVGLANATWGTLVASLPMLWVIRRLLLGPYGLPSLDVFGLRLQHGAWRPLLGVTLVLIGIEQTLGILSALLGEAAGVSSHWAYSVSGELIWESPLRSGLEVVETVAWAPLFEEIAFRGLIFTSLRARLRPLPAAALSAALFAVIHTYSWVDLAGIFGGAVASALVYHRTRSLAPSILSHAFHNAVAAGVNVFLYR